MANLVRTASGAAVLPAAAQRALARTPDLGGRGSGLSPGQHRSPHSVGVPGCADRETAVAQGRAACGICVCAAPGASGIGRVDLRAEEHAFGSVLPGRTASVSALRPEPAAAKILAGNGTVRAGADEQNSNRGSARGYSRDLLVAARKSRLEARCAAAGAVVCDRDVRRTFHLVGGEEIYRRDRCGLYADSAAARADCRPRDLFLRGQTVVANEIGVFLSALERRCGGLVAVAVSGGSSGAGRGAVVGCAPQPRAVGKPAHLCGNAIPGARIFECLSVPLFLCG